MSSRLVAEALDTLVYGRCPKPSGGLIRARESISCLVAEASRPAPNHGALSHLLFGGETSPKNQISTPKGPTFCTKWLQSPLACQRGLDAEDIEDALLTVFLFGFWAGTSRVELDLDRLSQWPCLTPCQVMLKPRLVMQVLDTTRDPTPGRASTNSNSGADLFSPVS